MSNAARKARKQAGEKFVRIPKEKHILPVRRNLTAREMRLATAAAAALVGQPPRKNTIRRPAKEA